MPAFTCICLRFYAATQGRHVCAYVFRNNAVIRKNVATSCSTRGRLKASKPLRTTSATDRSYLENVVDVCLELIAVCLHFLEPPVRLLESERSTQRLQLPVGLETTQQNRNKTYIPIFNIDPAIWYPLSYPFRSEK